MVKYVLIVLLVGLMAGILGLHGMGAVAVQLAGVLFAIEIVFIAIYLATGRTVEVS